MEMALYHNPARVETSRVEIKIPLSRRNPLSFLRDKDDIKTAKRLLAPGSAPRVPQEAIPRAESEPGSLTGTYFRSHPRSNAALLRAPGLAIQLKNEK